MQRVVWVCLFFYSFFSYAEDTVLKLYRPFGDVIDQIQPVAFQSLAGQCDGPSERISREDAWHCTAEGKVFDPCFVSMDKDSKQALCPQSPWSQDSVFIEVKEPFNSSNHPALDMSRTFPWGVELSNGELCMAVNSREEYDSMPVRYRCEGDHILVGHLQRCKPVWSMLEKTASGVASVAFKKVWF